MNTNTSCIRSEAIGACLFLYQKRKRPKTTGNDQKRPETTQKDRKRPSMPSILALGLGFGTPIYKGKPQSLAANDFKKSNLWSKMSSILGDLGWTKWLCTRWLSRIKKCQGPLQGRRESSPICFWCSSKFCCVLNFRCFLLRFFFSMKLCS